MCNKSNLGDECYVCNIEEHDHARRIATLSANMLNEVVAHVVGDNEVNEPTR